MPPSTTTAVYTYLTMTNGPRLGANFLLEGGDEFLIGRGLDCTVVLSDPMCSRVHAVIHHTDDGWFLRDSNSRNGSYVNGQKIDEARLIDGSRLKLGSAEFMFRQSASRPTDTVRADGSVTQTIIRDAPIAAGESSSVVVSALKDSEKAKDFLVLHQLSVKLLGCNDPDQVVESSLNLLLERSRASMAGFLWVNDEGQLKPKLIVPADATEVALSESLTEIVCRQGRAVWIDNSTARNSESLSHFADAICVPLIHNKSTLGAIHLYLEQGRFHQNDFDFSISLANILVVALVRSREQRKVTLDLHRLQKKTGDSDELVGNSKPMTDLKAKIKRIAQATGSVLVRGESGSGKELVARAIHTASNRADRPMLSVNCAAMPRDLMDSQLFGHRKGAFTGAESDHIGWFQQANSGMLFLDEVGEMTLEGQAKLLRILEGHPFMPVGATKEVTVDVRVIAATNRDLRDFVRDGKFREDLYYRLSVFELYIPPLRERGADIELLTQHFLDHFKLQHGRSSLHLSDAARQKLLGYQWPGNVRQLRNVIDSCVVMAETDEIQAEDLGLRDVGGGELQTLSIEFWERKLIREALGRSSGNVPEAAKLLGIGRATLYRKIEEYAIDR
ncbi:MAG TPA: sigma 54-interacting transcriptional regulator [Pirellulaceae bacterium]|nr:sigma 54-interacting transcriptional regulator [Pirellulaceae bacterium]